MTSRRYPVGAEVVEGGAHFRVWAPQRQRVAVRIEDGGVFHTLAHEADGYFSGLVPHARPGTRYRIALDGGDAYPDPASRFQPDGPHGPSEVIDPAAFPWTDSTWRGAAIKGQVIYEMHIGTFTKEGTWAAATRELPELADCGITCLEVMPVSEFPGRFGWGYDGVNLYAPTRLYGSPDDFRRFVDSAHSLGIAVILDVVYNHLGPDGNYITQFSPAYFTDKYETEWGEPINFDGPDSGPVREFFLNNARYWIDEFHLDGLRLDATQNIYDDTPDPAKHILTGIGQAVRAAAKGRATIIVAENEPQHPRLVRSVDHGGYGLDGLWNDDFHHSAMVALTGRAEAYYTDYRGSPQEFISAVKYGYLYQGQWYSWQSKDRGQSGLDLSPAAFVTFIQNHDQVANSARGLRAHLLTSPGRYRAMMALMLLAPGTPMLFQGQEFASSSPFHYFADHVPDLASKVNVGRIEFLSQFYSMEDPRMDSVVAEPESHDTFARCKLDFAERDRNRAAYDLTRDLLRLRREDPAFRLQRRESVDGAVIGDSVFVLRFFVPDGTDRLLIVNFGRDLHLPACAEPLTAPPEGMKWSILFSTEDPRYGGTGTPPVAEDASGRRFVGEAAMVLAPVPMPPEPTQPPVDSHRRPERKSGKN